MNNLVNKRSEIVFLYDATDINPNGDPVDENKPRIDEGSGKNIVTDVRLKRTIRDYFYDFKKMEIFVREIKDDNENVQDAKLRAKDFLLKNGNKIVEKELTSLECKTLIDENIIKDCVDVRMFGATIPISLKGKDKPLDSSITYTGAVQFKMGRSLHKVDLTHIKGTGAFASGEGKKQATFREEYFLPYSLIGFYGLINENAAKSTKMTLEDVDLLMDGIWNGTKNLISRSKIGQVPRLLLRVEFKEENYHIGELDKYITLVTDKREEEIRDPKDYKLDVTGLFKKLNENKDKIEKVYYKLDERINLIKDGQDFKVTELFGQIQELKV